MSTRKARILVFFAFFALLVILKRMLETPSQSPYNHINAENSHLWPTTNRR